MNRNQNQYHVVPEILPNKSILNTQEVFSGENIDEFDVRPVEGVIANEQFNVHEAKTVNESVSNEREASLNNLDKIGTEIAIQNIFPCFGLEVEQADYLESENDLKRKQLNLLKAKYDIMSNLPINITETTTEQNTKKFYPEIIVATEAATINVVEMHPCEQAEIHASEKEDSFQINSNLPKYTANISLLASSSIEVEQIDVKEKENILVPTKIEKPSKATDKLDLLNYVQIEQVPFNLESYDLTAETLTTEEHANFSLENQLASITEYTDALQKETEFDQAPKCLTSKATTDIVCNADFALVQQPMVHEAEPSEFTEMQTFKQEMVISTGSIAGSLQIQDQQPFDTVVVIPEKPGLKERNACVVYSTLNPVYSSTIITCDKEDKLAEYKSEQRYIQSEFIENSSVELMVPTIAECEKHLDQNPLVEQRPIINLSHTFSSSTVSEVKHFTHPEDISESMIKKYEAKLSTEYFKESSAKTIIPYECLGEYLAENVVPTTARTDFVCKDAIEVLSFPMLAEKEQIMECVQMDQCELAAEITKETLNSIIVDNIQTTDDVNDLKIEQDSEKYATIFRGEQKHINISQDMVYDAMSNLSDISDLNHNLNEVRVVPVITERKPILVTFDKSVEKESSLPSQPKIEVSTTIAFQTNTSTLVTAEVEPDESISKLDVTRKLDLNHGKISFEMLKHVTEANEYTLENVGATTDFQHPVTKTQNVKLSETLISVNVEETLEQHTTDALSVYNQTTIQANPICDMRRELNTDEIIAFENMATIEIVSPTTTPTEGIYPKMSVAANVLRPMIETNMSLEKESYNYEQHPDKLKGKPKHTESFQVASNDELIVYSSVNNSPNLQINIEKGKLLQNEHSQRCAQKSEVRIFDTFEASPADTHTSEKTATKSLILYNNPLLVEQSIPNEDVQIGLSRDHTECQNANQLIAHNLQSTVFTQHEYIIEDCTDVFIKRVEHSFAKLIPEQSNQTENLEDVTSFETNYKSKSAVSDFEQNRYTAVTKEVIPLEREQRQFKNSTPQITEATTNFSDNLKALEVTEITVCNSTDSTTKISTEIQKESMIESSIVPHTFEKIEYFTTESKQYTAADTYEYPSPTKAHIYESNVYKSKNNKTINKNSRESNKFKQNDNTNYVKEGRYGNYYIILLITKNRLSTKKKRQILNRTHSA